MEPDMMEPGNQMASIRKAVQQKDAQGLEKSFVNHKDLNDSDHWDLIGLLSPHVDDDTLKSHPEFFEMCEKGLHCVINDGNPSELLLAFLEQADTLEDVTKFQTFLQLLLLILMKINVRQQFSLELALETLSDCIKNLDLPKDEDIDEHKMYDFDPEVVKAVAFLDAYLNFLEPFVKQASSQCAEQFSGENAERQVKILTKYLMQCFKHPVLEMDVTIKMKAGKQVISNVRTCAGKLVGLLWLLHVDLHEFIRGCIEWNNNVAKLVKERQFKQLENDAEDNQENDPEDVEENPEDVEPVPMLALSCLAYTIYAESMVNTSFHSLFPMQCLFEQNLLFILMLMNHTHSEAKRKGVLLLEVLIKKLGEATLSYEDLDRQEYFRIFDSIFEIMVHCPMKDIRTKCVPIVPNLIQLFSLDARYQIYLKLFSTLKHSGAIGFCIQLFKNQLAEVVAMLETGSTIPGHQMFINLHLKRIFLLITSLEDGATTDLVENSDKIIAGLNFIRYLALRDPPAVNRTSVWTYMSRIESKFLKQLQTGLEMSKAHFQLELTGLEEKREKKSSETDEIETSLCVGGYKLPKMERGQRIAITNMALNTLDLMTSLLVRVNEVLDQQKKNASQ